MVVLLLLLVMAVVVNEPLLILATWRPVVCHLRRVGIGDAQHVTAHRQLALKQILIRNILALPRGLLSLVQVQARVGGVVYLVC